MPVDWMDTSDLPFDALLLLERVQLSWFPGWVPERDLAIALRAHPTVAWYLRTKCPQIASWVDGIVDATPAEHTDASADPAIVRDAERSVLRSITDLLVYAIDPSIYDAQPFLGWNSRELTGLVDFASKRVIDVGCGTGRLTFAVADIAETVFAVDPVANLRRYVKEKAAERRLSNVFAVDGLITDLPFPAGFADVTMGGHVFGDDPDDELAELQRVTRAGGTVILCPGNDDVDDDRHALLTAAGFSWARFEEPTDGMKRKYWRTLA